MNVNTFEPIAPLTAEPIVEATTIPEIETSSTEQPTTKTTSTTKRVVSTILSAVGAGALIGV